MKLFLYIMSVLLTLVLKPVNAQTPAMDELQLTVRINGLENNEGKVMIALCNSREDYEAKEKAFRTAALDIREQTAIHTFINIPQGEYALKVFHDEDENGELNANFLGIPSEAYGFSNNARGSFGPASWEDVRFRFTTATDTLVIVVE
jgi:uncharacterized protein (DUF2141 family)